VSSTRADAQQLLAWHRGHWTVAANHDVRDRTLDEDACLTSTNNGPSNQALCNNRVLAFIIRQHRFASVPQALRHFNRHRQAAIDAVLSPT